MRTATYLFAVYFLLNGLYLLTAPMHFYSNTPGVAAMGPFNFHFIVDVSFAFIAASIGLAWGNFRGLEVHSVVAAIWPFLHALFHLQIWAKRNFVLDSVSQSDFVAVIIPGLAALWLAGRIQEVSA